MILLLDILLSMYCCECCRCDTAVGYIAADVLLLVLSV